MKDKLQDIPNELKLLRAEWSRIDNALNRQYYICDDLANGVRAAKQNVEAMRVRLNTDSQSLSNANINLEAARAEKELADIAVEELITVYTSALPFSIVPNGNGVNIGTPVGNNPSGSALGAVTSSGQTVGTQQVSIGSLNSYLSSAYSMGVDPARPSTVTTLYPLSVNTLSTVAGSLGTHTCSGTNTVTGSGQILSVQPGNIQVQTNSGNMNLSVSGCSNLESIYQGQVLTAGDPIYYRGTQGASANSLNLQSLTCV